MRQLTSLVLILYLSSLTSFAQRQQYYQGMPIAPICPKETAPFFTFKAHGNELPPRPFVISANSNPFVPVATTAPEGFYFFKRNKKRPKPSYPKTSNIIRF